MKFCESEKYSLFFLSKKMRHTTLSKYLPNFADLDTGSSSDRPKQWSLNEKQMH